MKLLLSAVVVFCAPLFSQTIAQTPAQTSFRGSADVDAVVSQAISEDKIPGAVLLVGHKGQVIYRKAYGSRALVPVKDFVNYMAVLVDESPTHAFLVRGQQPRDVVGGLADRIKEVALSGARWRPWRWRGFVVHA